MNAPDVPINRMYPAPRRPTRLAWTMVAMPLTSSAAHAAHDRKSSLWPAVRTTIATVRTTGPSVSRQYCRANPMVTGQPGFSSGWNRTPGPDRLTGSAMGLPFLRFVDQAILNLAETASLRETSDA